MRERERERGAERAGRERGLSEGAGQREKATNEREGDQGKREG